MLKKKKKKKKRQERKKFYTIQKNLSYLGTFSCGHYKEFNYNGNVLM